MANKVDFYATYGLKIDQTPTNNNTLSLDHVNNRVGIQIGTSTPRSSLDVGFATDSVVLPRGSTAQRPGTPIGGMFRFNTSTSGFEGYNGTSWVTQTQPSISNSTSTSTFYLTFSSTTSGSLSLLNVDSAGIKYVPSTGMLTTPQLTVTNAVTVGTNLSVTGNLTVSGKLTVSQLDQNTITTLYTYDNFIELGRVNNALPTASTTYDLGLTFNYFDTQSRQSAVFWKDNTGFAFAADASVPNTTQSSSQPQVTINDVAPIVVDSVYIGSDFTSTNQVINASKSIINCTMDCGSY